MGETNSNRQYIALLYKGLLLRKRHYVVTFFEVVIPVLAICILPIIQSELSASNFSPPDDDLGAHDFDPTKKSLMINYSTFAPFDPFKSEEYSSNDLQFVFIPGNIFTKEFMEQSIELFKKNSGYKGDITKVPFNTEKEMENYCLFKQTEDKQLLMIGTVFDDFELGQLPKSLNYKIRYGSLSGGDTFRTQFKYRANGPQITNAYVDTFYLSWQTAVEETFIDRMNPNKDFKYKVWMQRFPYPEHRDSRSSFSIISLVPMMMCYGYIVFFTCIIQRTIEEKVNGSKELLKMMGMTDSVYWSSTFSNYFIVGFFTMLITTIIYKIPMKNGYVFLKNTNFMLLFIVLLLFIALLILFCLAVTVFFPKATFAVIVALLAFLVGAQMMETFLFFQDADINYFPLSLIQKLSICLFPPGALLTCFLFISYYESTNEGLNWSNISEYTVSPDMNFIMVMCAMVVSIYVYMFIIWYFDKVWPWQPGVPKSIFFPITDLLKMRKNKPAEHDQLELVVNGASHQSSDFFEEEPSGSTPGVVIQHLSKQFRVGIHNKLAVNNISLNIYKGQITALLGHNGAGKTTTINILTGLFSPSSGYATINGIDILKDTVKARRGLGVCPQHNVLYNTLTVEEHLKIYAAMKGVKYTKVADEIKHVLETLKLEDKKSELVKNLSGGMKRKLCLGMAIVGGSKVLFLDEPTSGMDVEARRSVWDALLELRHDRTIILTTHYMEEADILGDRIAIMAEGEIQCCGSPMFLKRKFGTGYRLHIVKDSHFDLNGVTKLLQEHVPESSLENELEKEISFNLTSHAGSSFGDLFESLEIHKENLGITSCGITITTMEDVFLNVANISDIKYKLNKGSNLENGPLLEFEDVYGETKELKANRNLPNQLYGLLVKRFHYSKRHWPLLISQLALPFGMMCFLLSIISSTESQNQMQADPIKLDLFQIYGSTNGFYTPKIVDSPHLQLAYKTVLENNKVTVTETREPTHYILDYGKKDFSKYLKSFLVGGVFDTNIADGSYNLTAWYNGEPYHVTPISLSLMHTAILKHLKKEGSISCINAPLPHTISYYHTDQQHLKERIMAAVFVPLALGILSASFVLLPIHERVTKAKLLQLMTGISAMLYWLTMFLWDFMVHCIVCILLIIPFAIFSHYAFFAPHSDAIGTALLMMILYGWSSIPFSYIMSFLFKKPNSGFSGILNFVSIVGVAASTTLTTLQLTFAQYGSKTIDVLIWVFRIFPTFAVSSGFAQLFGIAYNNAMCEKFSEDDLKINCNAGLQPWNPLYLCCKNLCGDHCLNQTYPITWDTYACGRDIFFLFIDGFIYFGILLLLETTFMAAIGRIIKRQIMIIRKKVSGDIVQFRTAEDSDVLQEEERIRNSLSTFNDSGTDALVVSNLTKVFQNFYAVDHLTFGIHKEECFGLLGVNGAGKTTTFRMLCGDCYPTEGNAFIQNWHLRTELKKFQSHLGYCPQFDALIDRLTGNELLTLFGRLRGLSGLELEKMVEKLIKMTDLVAHADKQTRFYSGGNKRKLSVAISLIGSPPLILLDEPTAGVDPVSRRKIWNILAQARNNTKAAILLTTHSMEESEALCSRLAIMVNGRFRCLGSIQQLKSKYGQGYTLIIKMKRQNDSYDNMNRIKNHVNNNLSGAELKDDHQGMLQYHIVDPSVTLSRLFKFMAEMKDQFDLEDYLISDTSLEQIFLTFARSQRIR